MSDHVLRLVNVGKTFGRHRALADVSLAFLPGQVAAVLGPNGAGQVHPARPAFDAVATVARPHHAGR